MSTLFHATRRSLLAALAATHAARAAVQTPRAMSEIDDPAQGRMLDAVRPEDFGGRGDGKTDDSAALQSALGSGQSVVLRHVPYNIGTAGLLVRTTGSRIIGNNAEPHYYSTGNAIDAHPTAAAIVG